MKQKQSKIFRCRLTSVRGRAETFISFKKAFWHNLKQPHRVFFFEDEGAIIMSFIDPFHKPMYKVYARRLQYAGRDDNSFKVVIPMQLVRKHNIKRFNTARLHRWKNHNGQVFTCFFEYDPDMERKIKMPTASIKIGIDLPLEDLLC